MPSPSQRPSVDNIANKIDSIGVVALQEVKQEIGLRTAGTEMNVGDEQGPEATFGTLVTHVIASHASEHNNVP
jgi:hypothetical protein